MTKVWLEITGGQRRTDGFRVMREDGGWVAITPSDVVLTYRGTGKRMSFLTAGEAMHYVDTRVTAPPRLVEKTELVEV